MSGANRILGELAPERKNIRAAVSKDCSETIGVVKRGQKGFGRQNNLELATIADLKSDVEHAVAKLKLRRRFNEKDGIKAVGRHSTPRGNATTEPSLCAVSHMNANLQRKLTSRFTTGFQPVEFVGMEDVGNRPIPLFKIAPPPLAHGRDAPTSRPTISEAR